jgi:hypothetical protein
MEAGLPDLHGVTRRLSTRACQLLERALFSDNAAPRHGFAEAPDPRRAPPNSDVV